MSPAAVQTGRPERRLGKAPDTLVFIVIILGVWLAWQVVRGAATAHLPPQTALRLAPGSAHLLSRAAEGELKAGRPETARRLAQRALQKAPLNVRALRVAGLAAMETGDEASADRILTLAGNWSLRDDLVHGWLVARRMRQNQSASALAHADTLMRRRIDMQPAYFDMMIALALKNDTQAQGALVRLLQRDPPWRTGFFLHAAAKRETTPVAAAAAAALATEGAPLTEAERSLVYSALVRWELSAALPPLRSRLEGDDRPTLTDGGFESGGGAAPFGWRMPTAPGVLSEIAVNPEGDGHGLYASLGDMGGRTVAEQLVLLTPGRWRLTGRLRAEQNLPQDRVAWTVTCASAAAASTQPAVTLPLGPVRSGAWRRFSGDVVVSQACPALWLRLVSLPQDRRRSLDLRIDDVAFSPLR